MHTVFAIFSVFDSSKISVLSKQSHHNMLLVLKGYKEKVAFICRKSASGLNSKTITCGVKVSTLNPATGRSLQYGLRCRGSYWKACCLSQKVIPLSVSASVFGSSRRNWQFFMPCILPGLYSFHFFPYTWSIKIITKVTKN